MSATVDQHNVPARSSKWRLAGFTIMHTQFHLCSPNHLGHGQHDPMITDNALNPPKEWENYSFPVWGCLAVDNFGRNVLRSMTRSKPTSDCGASFRLLTKRPKPKRSFQHPEPPGPRSPDNTLKIMTLASASRAQLSPASSFCSGVRTATSILSIRSTDRARSGWRVRTIEQPDRRADRSTSPLTPALALYPAF